MLESCNSFYSCFQNIVILGLSIALFVFTLKAYFLIKKDRNHILTWHEKILIQKVVCQSLILSLYYSFFDNSVLFLTIRTLRCTQEIICVAFILQLTIYKEKANKIFQIGMIVSIFLWICGFEMDDQFGYNCDDSYYVLISGLTLVSSSINIFMGRQGILQMSSQNQIQLSEQENIYLSEHQIIQKQKQYLLLINVCFLTSTLQFFLDVFMHKWYELQCNYGWQPQDIIEMFILILIKTSTNLLPIALIYYIVYYSNYQNFNVQESQNDKKQNMNHFFDNRSFDIFSQKSEL